MAGHPLQGRDCPRYGYTVWTGDREVIESVIRKGTAQIAVEISFKGFWAVSLALKVVFSDWRPAQG
jgi:hypothetical protein